MISRDKRYRLSEVAAEKVSIGYTLFELTIEVSYAASAAKLGSSLISK